MVVLTNHMLTGVCVCLCVIPGFGVVLCFGPNYPCLCFIQLCTKSQERERERVRPGGSPFPEQKR